MNLNRHLAHIFMLLSVSLFALADLSAIKNLNHSAIYTVMVDGVQKPVYESRESYQRRGGTIEQGNGITKMSFVNFDLPEEGPQTVVVTLPKPVSEYEIRPFTTDVLKQAEGNTLTMTLSQPVKLVIKEIDSWENVLCVFVNPWHQTPCSCGVRYFFGEPRLYDYYQGGADIDPSDPQNDLKNKEDVRALDLKDGETVYIAEGAVVRVRFNVPNDARVKIYGRGVLAYGLGHHEDFGVVAANLGPKQVTLEGLTICDAPGWNIRIFGGRDHLIENIKTVGFWHFNTDGIQFGGENSTIRNCFLQCNDDNFSFSGGGKNFEVHDNILWNLYNGGVFNFGWGNPQYQNVTIRDNVVLRYGDCCGVDPNNPTPEVERRKAPFTMITYGGEKIDGLTFRNITIEEIIGQGEWIHFIHLKNGDGYVRNLQFENINILSQNKVWGILKGTSGGGIDGVTFHDVFINGEQMTTADQAGLVLENTTNVSFTGSTAIAANPSAQAPEAVHLFSNYPNPFNPSTVIRYRVSVLCRVTCAVYGVSGRLISVLVDREQAPGDYQVIFHGLGLASGVYSVKIEVAAGGQTFSKKQKMVLIR